MGVAGGTRGEEVPEEKGEGEQGELTPREKEIQEKIGKKQIAKSAKKSIEGIDALLKSDNVTDSEKSRLGRKKEQFEDLIRQIEE